MKEAISNLIEKLASKELTFGCRVLHDGRKKLVLSLWDGTVDRLAGGEHHQTYCDTLYMLEEEPQNFEFDDEITCVSTGRWEFGNAPSPIKDQIEILGHPIYLHDVLEKIGFNWAKKAVDEHLHNTVWILEKAQNDLMKLWNPCGFTKSLQSIVDEAEWEGEQQPNGQPKHVVGSRIVLVPKQPAIRKLFQLLLQLNLAE